MLLAGTPFRKRRGGIVVGVVDDIPAVLVMADVAASPVPDDHAPGLGLPVPAERPRAGAVGLDAVERVDGAVVPFDAPGDVLTIGAAFDEGRNQTYRLLALPHDGIPLESITNACSIIAQSRLLTIGAVAAAARPVQIFGIVLRSAMYLQALSEGSVAYACSGNYASGGVARRAARLRGQSIIEYVLIAAIIGLVVIFAGPQVSGAIRNQFNQVTNTVDSGTSGDGFMSAEEKAYREAMKTVAQKEAKDWTLDEQKAAATDIAKSGTSSVVYAKAKAAMDAGTTWSVKLTNGETIKYRIIGINHDDLADGTGKAGLTFMTTQNILHNTSTRFNSTANKNAGGWEASEIRAKMNSGEIWSLLPSDFQSKVKTVRKLTNNVGGGDANKNAAVTATSDRLFLLSYSEIVSTSYWAAEYPWTSNEGTQYEAFKGVVMNNNDANPALAFDRIWWERSVDPRSSMMFLAVYYDGNVTSRAYAGNSSEEVFPACCF